MFYDTVGREKRFFDSKSRGAQKRWFALPALSRGQARSSGLMTRFEYQLLNPPIQQFGDVDFGL